MIERLTFHQEDIRGWAKEGEQDKDSMELANILRRKTTFGTLPQIDQRIINFTNIRQKNSQVKFLDIKKCDSPTCKTFLKSTRLKTQGFKVILNDNKNVKKKPFSNTIIEQSFSPILPKSHTKSHIFQDQKQKKAIHINKSESCEFKRSNYLELKVFDIDKLQLFREDAFKAITSKNQDKIISNQSQVLKNTFDQIYGKLNTLKKVKDVRKQLTDHSLSKSVSPANKQYYFNSDNLLKKMGKDRQSTKKSKIIFQTMNKNDKQCKKPFKKQDILNKQRQKLQELEKGLIAQEFNDQIIFSTNSLFFPKKQKNDLTTQFKIELIQNPQRHLLNFK